MVPNGKLLAKVVNLKISVKSCRQVEELAKEKRELVQKQSSSKTGLEADAVKCLL